MRTKYRPLATLSGSVLRSRSCASTSRQDSSSVASKICRGTFPTIVLVFIAFVIAGKTLRGGFLRARKSTNLGGGLLRRKLSILSGCERDRTKIALSRLATTVAGALSGIGWRSSFVALNLRGSIRRYAAETQKQ